ncbi:SusE domain-containing protein [Mucilaginibacter sp.]
MKKLINLTLIAIACLAFACHKEAALTTLATVSFNAPLTATTNSVAITTADTSSNVITFNWPAVVYPYKAHVTYTLQVDLPTDTTGSTGWANATSVTIGNDILTKAYKGTDFNNLALTVGIGANDTGKLVFRVQAYQDRNVYSKPVTVTVSTYKKIVVPPAFSENWPVLYVPGAYQGNAPASAGTLAAEVSGIYEGYIYVSNASTNTFAFTNSPDLSHIIYGAGTSAGTLSASGKANSLSVPATGYYELVANTNNLTWTATPITWSIIGDATPGGWSNDTEMAYNANTNTWTVTAVMVSSGSFKFRANNAWSIDFGIDANGHIQYADNPAYPYNGTLNNLTVAANGTYKITLDLSNPNYYNYTAVKQ